MESRLLHLAYIFTMSMTRKILSCLATKAVEVYGTVQKTKDIHMICV